MIEAFNIIPILAIMILPFLGSKRLSYVAIIFITIQIILASTLAIQTFSNGLTEYCFKGSFITGNIPVRIDYLSAWFILLISFTFLTGAFYGVQYMKKYRDQTGGLILHAIAFVFAYTALIDICMVQNAIVFLFAWEIMTLSAFALVIFEYYKKETLFAGINYLIQAHISIVFLIIAFIWVKVKTGSFDFSVISDYSVMHPAMGIGLFLFFFFGFAIKAGFVPFHTWLPVAHPAAPAHISGIMSGVIIKIGIYGILRMLTLIKADFTLIGYYILIISVITGLYGVMLAIVQHNLKRLLAYHSIENIGIIGIGIGVGCLGLGSQNQFQIVAGFGGALLHTLNHSLFKSLLFFSAGNVYQTTHTMNIESLGGLIKKMPRTSLLFLIGSLAICGLPPFNGFVSEFFIYIGLFKGLASNHFIFSISMLFTIAALVLIGGLALICFTKAFGIVFLGTNRDELIVDETEKPLSIYPLYFIALAIIVIGFLPFMFSPVLLKTIALFNVKPEIDSQILLNHTLANITVIGLFSLGFVVLSLIIFFIRTQLAHHFKYQTNTTWGCAHSFNGNRMQYSASSFIRAYRKLTEPLLSIKKDKKLAIGIYPGSIEQITHPYDKVEQLMIDKPIFLFRRVLNRFLFLQNGNIQSYILYGFIFLATVIVLPLIFSKIMVLINLINQL